MYVYRCTVESFREHPQGDALPEDKQTIARILLGL